MLPTLLPTSPQRIAADTWLIPTLAAEPSGAFIGAHSLVIAGAEPVIVDTGASLVRASWESQVFSVVDPADVRWIFLSHDDHDHLGNLDLVLDRCPNATLIASYSIVSRLAGDIELPLERMRWLDAGESLDIGDRVLSAVRPPMFDSPSTRGVYDSATSVLWAADSFGALVPGAVYDADDVPDDMYRDSFAVLNLSNTPWLEWSDRARFARHVQDSASLSPSVVASAHGPVLRGDRIDDAYRRTLDLVGSAPPARPGQDVLEMLVAMLAVA